MFLANPVIAGGESRMLPQTFRGVSLTNHSLDGWMIEGGQASFTKPCNQSGHTRIGTSYGSLADGDESKHLNWAGVAWSGPPGLTSAVSYSRGELDLTKVDPDSPGYASWYNADGVLDQDTDEYRVIVDYPLNVF